jgi:hypothetical protein
VATSEQMKGKTWQEQRESCVNGHEFTGDNVRTYRGYRVCRQCKRDESQRQWKRSHPIKFSKQHTQTSLLPRLARAKGEAPKVTRKKAVDKANALIIEIKREPCVDCGGRFHHSAMDFDHMPGFTKGDTVSNLSSKGKPWARILEEIAKCQLVCANCHRVRTYNRRLASPV